MLNRRPPTFKSALSSLRSSFHKTEHALQEDLGAGWSSLLLPADIIITFLMTTGMILVYFDDPKISEVLSLVASFRPSTILLPLSTTCLLLLFLFPNSKILLFLAEGFFRRVHVIVASIFGAICALMLASPLYLVTYPAETVISSLLSLMQALAYLAWYILVIGVFRHMVSPGGKLSLNRIPPRAGRSIFVLLSCFLLGLRYLGLI